jgi:hypothetical protein
MSDQQRKTRRVQKAHAAQIDSQRGSLRRDRTVERGLELGCRGHVDLAVNGHQHLSAAVPRLDYQAAHINTSNCAEASKRRRADADWHDDSARR